MLRVEAGHDREAVLAALFEAGASGVHEDGEALVTHLPPDVDLIAVAAAVRDADPSAHMTSAPLAAVDWSEAWKEGLRAHEIDGLVIAPPWLADRFDPARTVIIEPEMAFGTGDHPTTRGVARLMQRHVRPGHVVADLGAGSAVLSIAAAKLGARRVTAIEMDPDAISNAEQNVVRNGVDDRVAVLEGDAEPLLPLLAPVDVILANIISSVLMDLLPAMAASLAPGGVVILSGILLEECVYMREAFRAGAWRELDEVTEGAWWSVAIARP